MFQWKRTRAPGALEESRSRRAQWQADLLFLLFASWMIGKQYLALRAIGQGGWERVLLAIIGSVLVVSPWIRLARGRWQALAYLLLNGLLTTVVYGDIIYFRQFGDLVSIASLRFAGQLTTVSSSVTALIQPSDVWLWADLPLFLLLALLPQGARELWLAGARLRSAVAVALVGVIIVGVLAAGDPVLAEKYYGHTMVSSRMGLINYHAFDTGSYLRRMASKLSASDEEVAEVKGWFEKKRRAAAAPSALWGKYRGKNVIVLQIESLQAFPLGLRVEGQEITPNLNRLAAESLHFTNFYHQTGQGVTSDADLLANCSLYPTRTGAVYYDYATNDFRCMPRLVREAGYKAVAMQGMPPDFWNLQAVYPHVGFERYYSIKDFNADEKIGIGLSDESFLRQAAHKLKGLSEPYYAFLATLTSHGPFDFEGLPRTLRLGKLEGTKAGHYLQAVHYTDKAIGLFLQQLKAEGILDRSVLVMYGDHTGVWPHESGMADLLGFSKDDAVANNRTEDRVPFMVRLPDGGLTGERPQIAGQVDIAPTLAGLLGIHLDDAYFMGRDLLSKEQGVIAYYNGNALDGKHLFLHKEGDPESGKCFAETTGARVELSACDSLAEQARRQLEISRLIVERNLMNELLAPAQR